MEELTASLLALVVETSTNMPSDVRRAVASWRDREQPGALAGNAVGIICRNVDLALADRLPICQDTGMPTFWVRAPRSADHAVIRDAVREAISTATKMGKLRPNSVDSVAGRNSGLNLGPGTPVIHIEQGDDDGELEVFLLLKGGGCENTSTQYALPCDLEGVGRADRSLDGAYRCILHAVHAAQGHGCSPGFLGVCIGSDRAEGYAAAKHQLLRAVDDVSPDPALAKLEQQVMATVNGLRIGPMGFRGEVTLLGCKIAARNRVPASFFVSIAYNCWAYRRMGVRLDASSGAIKEWMFSRTDPCALAPAGWKDAFDSARRISTPISEDVARSLKIGELVLLSGEIHTGRDALHKHLVHNESPVDLRDGVLYHCGPVMLRSAVGDWEVQAAGPTTSIREEPYQASVLRRFGLRAVIGKGGMGDATSEALAEVGAVYLNAIGGAAAYYAACMGRVTGVHFLEEFGVPEAMWHIVVDEFPAVVTMDASGASLHREVHKASQALLGPIVATAQRA